jgi:hypothetical protein
MTDIEKQKLIGDVLGSRIGRRRLGRVMVMPLLGKKMEGWHDCVRCSRYIECKAGVDFGVGHPGYSSGDCWSPEGVLVIWEERRLS